MTSFGADQYMYYYNENKVQRLLQLRLHNISYRLLVLYLFFSILSICLYYNFKKDRTNILPNTKVILLWSHKDYAPFYYFGEGYNAFIRNNCSFTNCYVTSNMYLLDDVTEFDAIAFNGRCLLQSKHRMPKRRSPHQKYIYVNSESSEYYPVYNDIYDSFFNWTATYRLDSDIPLTYILVKNKSGHIVGPKTDMKWPKDMDDIDNDMVNKLRGKTKSVAWFVSNCNSRSRREEFVKRLKRELTKYNLKVDVYGKCGTFNCPRDNSDCNKMIERDYYFYLALENSIVKDYVTEKILRALNNDVVPIVQDGLNYSRFLPKGSYLTGSPKSIALNILRSVRQFSHYKKFFKWKQHYTFSNPEKKENVCALCAALNNKTLVETIKVYRNFRRWWNPNSNEYPAQYRLL